MQLSKTLPVVALMALCLFSCRRSKKDTTETPAPLIYQNYVSLKEGNYWIYERYQLDTGGMTTPTGIYDSLYVGKDTSIRGNIYHRYMWTYESNTAYEPQYLRDSLHYVVDHKGEIIFSSLDFTNEFERFHYIQPLIAPDTIALVKHHMGDKDFIMATPAGVFKTSAFRKDYHMFPPLDKYGKVRSFVYRYAENVGLVSEILPWFVYHPLMVERRLVRYHIAK